MLRFHNFFFRKFLVKIGYYKYIKTFLNLTHEASSETPIIMIPNPILLHCRQNFYHLSHQESPMLIQVLDKSLDKKVQVFKKKLSKTCKMLRKKAQRTFWPTQYLNNIYITVLLLLLLSCFSRVQLCATP